MVIHYIIYSPKIRDKYLMYLKKKIQKKRKKPLKISKI